MPKLNGPVRALSGAKLLEFRQRSSPSDNCNATTIAFPSHSFFITLKIVLGKRQMEISNIKTIKNGSLGQGKPFRRSGH
jgi:hypothetical protein